ncbi:MAG: hypothetical protein ACRCW2_13335 [Cellulosilyticaceae bacterium]
MEDLQMDYVIKKIRENEEKTQELTGVLEGFHQSFERLIGNIERVVEAGTIDQATKSVRQLDTRLGRMEKQLHVQHEEGKNVLEQMTEQLGRVQKGTGKIEAIKPTSNEMPQTSGQVIAHQDRIYVIDEDRKTINACTIKDGHKDVYHVHDRKIVAISRCGDAVYIYDEDKKIYETTRILEPILEDVVIYAMSYYGIVYKNPMGNLKLYKYDGNQKSLAKRVGYFEVVEGRYLLLQTNKGDKQLIDLKVLNVDQPVNIK